MAIHLLILFSLVRFGADWIVGSGGGDRPGPRGGGGGGDRSGDTPRYVELPAAPPPESRPVPSPQPVVAAAAPVPVSVEAPVPDVPLLPPPTLAAPRLVTVATGTGPGTGTGQGPGSGGGSGGGTGGGVGTDSGPGRGGAGDYISLPDPRTVLLPAQCAPGKYTVHFWVEADGSVSRVNMEPLPKSSDCRREWQEKMLGYRFYPARTRDGRAVPAVATTRFTVGR